MSNVYGIDTDDPEFRKLSETEAECNRLARELRAADRDHRRHPGDDTAEHLAAARRAYTNSNRRYARLLNQRATNS